MFNLLSVSTAVCCINQAKMKEPKTQSIMGFVNILSCTADLATGLALLAIGGCIAAGIIPIGSALASSIVSYTMVGLGGMEIVPFIMNTSFVLVSCGKKALDKNRVRAH